MTTANVQNIAARKIAHKTENFSVELTEGKTQAAVLAEIKEANFTIGTKSLAQLMKGEKTEAGDFTLVGGMQVIDAAPKEADAPKTDNKTTKEQREAVKAQQKKDQAERAQAAKDAKAAQAAKNNESNEKKPEGEEVKSDQTAAPAGDTTTPPVNDKPAAAPKAPRVLKDWGDELPAAGVYMPLRPGSVIDRLFQMLVRPQGTNKAEMIAEFNWSAGGMSGILGWEPKKKGYHLASEKVDGVLTYTLQFHKEDKDRAGKRVELKDLTYVQPKPAPEPKAPKAPKEAKAPTAADPAAGQPTGGSRRKVSPKKQAELDAAAAAAANKAPEKEVATA